MKTLKIILVLICVFMMVVSEPRWNTGEDDDNKEPLRRAGQPCDEQHRCIPRHVCIDNPKHLSDPNAPLKICRATKVELEFLEVENIDN
jgi:hypothetical protein